MSANTPGPNPLPGAVPDKLTIDTPEQTELEFAIAGIGSRFLALALDTLIQAGMSLAGLLLGGLVGAGVAAFIPRGSLWYAGFLLLFFFLLYFGYFAFFEVLWNGQTPGKRATKIRVIKDTGRPMTPAEAIGRNVMRIVDQLPGMYAVGIASVLLSRQSKRLGDFVAGTIVVHERSLEDLRPLWQAQPGRATASYGAAALTPEEFALIEAFLNRRAALEPDVRFRMAEQIVGRIKSKLALPAGEALSGEKLLEAVAYERRAAARYA